MSARELNGLGADVAFGQATLETLARFSVMSRLRKHENSTLFAKMRVYDGESLKDSDPKARSVEESKDAAGVDEGMDGVSTRFAFKILAATFNHDTSELGADPVHLMYALEHSIRREQLPEEIEKRYLEFIKAELVPRMRNSLATRSRKPIWNPIRITVITCSIATWIMPMPGSKIRTSRTPTPASCSIASFSTRN